MDLFRENDLRDLVNFSSSPCVTVMMPAHRTGREIREDALRCKNLLNQAHEKLIQWGARTSVVRELLEPAWELQSDGEFWKHQSAGLAIFVGPDFCRAYRIPVEVPERVVVNDRFHVAPLFSLLQGDGRFYILATSQNDLRLLRGTRFTVARLENASLPKNLRESLNIDEYVKAFQYHSRSFRGGDGRKTEATYHGHGGNDMESKKKDELQQFLRRVEQALHPFLRDEKAPLVFAGVDYLFPMYQQANTYEGLMPQPVRGNPDKWSAQQLHDLAWPIVEPYFRQLESEALKRYADHSGTDKTLDDLKDVLLAAEQGVVDVLFTAREKSVWGQRQNGDLQIHDQPQAGDDDLVGAAAVQTWLHGGTVLTVDPDQLPGDTAGVALLRFAYQPVT